MSRNEFCENAKDKNGPDVDDNNKKQLRLATLWGLVFLRGIHNFNQICDYAMQWTKKLRVGILPSLHSGPPNVVMLQSQLKPSHCWRQTPWLAHESSWHVVLGPACGDKQQVGEQTFITTDSTVCSENKCHAQHRDNMLFQTEKHTEQTHISYPNIY